MNQKQIYDLLLPNEKEKVFIPNETFKDINKIELFKSASNIAFTYSYYCLITYLYRYCKYAQGQFFTPELMKEMLGYAGNNKTLDFIIKRDGILDCMQYTETIRDFPISYEVGDYHFLNFVMYSDLELETKKVVNMPKNFKVKYPVKAFYRNVESKDDEIYDGTFYDVSNTHLFDVYTFIDMLGNQELGVVGFYLYQFLKYKNDLFKDGYTISYKKLESETGISKNTICKYSKLMENVGYLRVINNGYKNGDDDNKEMLPKTYKTLNKGWHFS